MLTIAVFFGGQSAEHDVSIITALTSVIMPLELTNKYRVIPVYIAKDGRWFVSEDLKNIAVYQHGELKRLVSRMKTTGVICANGLKLLVPSRVGRKAISVDIAFPAMHGTHGEDGELTGIFEMAGVPYVGCGVAASAIAMDKMLAKQVVTAAGLATPRALYFDGESVRSNSAVLAKQCQQLTYPLFVKPAHLGSSIGISRVADKKELVNALEVAAHYDDKIVVEEAVPNLIEVTLPIMGPSSAPQPALLEQPLTHAEDFFDFDTKYMHGGKKGKGGGKKMGIKGAQGYSKIPANLSKELYSKAEAAGVAAYKALGCDGIARIDMLIDSKAKKVYFNEANPLPGSLYAHNWAQVGVSKIDLVEALVGYALDRHYKRSKLATTFDTNFLTQF
ncbi:D-alanine--D-alanine ligase [Candidatus Saccharibacteria bacterium]|nr:D-alanine--D-alanine ligase [Candidatus Saccharibacteria bacterium]